MKITLPQKIEQLFRSKKRYIVLYGGRGSGKSWAIAIYLITRAINENIRILCAREIQNSIKDSVHKLLKDQIDRMGLTNYFTITRDSIVSSNGSEFIFKGLWHNENDIKSTEGIDICWIEEAQSVSRVSLDVLTPTIRKENSQIIYSYNPTNDNDPVHVDYVLTERDDTDKIKLNYSDNPFFPDVLKDELEWDKKTDYDKYLHKWEGHCIAHSEAQIFYDKWTVEDFDTPDGVEFYIGADFGFAKDPTAVIRAFQYDNNLYIDHEAYGVGISLDNHPDLFDLVPGIRQVKITADSARPETIDFLQQRGFYIVPAKKGANSVTEGIERLKTFEKIIIHPRCKNTIDEFRFYCYKTDKRTGIISNVPEDLNNHIIDALRYATEDLITGVFKIRKTGVMV